MCSTQERARAMKVAEAISLFATSLSVNTFPLLVRVSEPMYGFSGTQTTPKPIPSLAGQSMGGKLEDKTLAKVSCTCGNLMFNCQSGEALHTRSRDLMLSAELQVNLEAWQCHISLLSLQLYRETLRLWVRFVAVLCVPHQQEPVKVLFCCHSFIHFKQASSAPQASLTRLQPDIAGRLVTMSQSSSSAGQGTHTRYTIHRFRAFGSLLPCVAWATHTLQYTP